MKKFAALLAGLGGYVSIPGMVREPPPRKEKPLKLVSSDDPILRKTATPVRKITSVHKRTARAMAAFLQESNNGIGLAAPQVGISKRIIAIKVEHNVLVVVNPEISELSDEKVTAIEGCLSLPGVQVPVERPGRCTLTGELVTGNAISFPARDLFARVIQHEVDHLNGVLITDYAVHSDAEGG